MKENIEKKDRKPLVEESSDIQNTSVNVSAEEENPGIGYEIVIGSGSN